MCVLDPFINSAQDIANKLSEQGDTINQLQKTVDHLSTQLIESNAKVDKLSTQLVENNAKIDILIALLMKDQQSEKNPMQSTKRRKTTDKADNNTFFASSNL